MKQILFILLLVFSNDSIAAWVEYSTRENGDIYFYDDSRVLKEDHQLKLWHRILYKTSIMGASSHQSLLKIDCINHTEATLQSTFYSDKYWSKAAMATNMNATPIKSIKKDSATKLLSDILCCK